MKYIRLILLLFIFVFSSNNYIFSQSITVSGRIINKEKEPQSFVNITIVDSKDSIISGVISDLNGNFSITANQEYLFKILTSSVGYSSKTILVDSNKHKNNIIKLGNIEIEKNTVNLSKVEINNFRNYVDKKFDRIVYSVSKDDIASSSSILDIIRLLPGVVVDQDGNIRFKGASASIFVNDQPAEYIYPNIEMIPVDRISKIELIDNAIFSGGTGLGGIINIKLKKIRSDGISGIISTKLTSSYFDKLNYSRSFLNINYKYKNFTLFNNFSFNNSIENSQTNIYKTINSFTSPFDHKTSNESEFTSRTLNNYIGLIYEPNEITRYYVGVGNFNFKYNYLINNVFTETDVLLNSKSNSYLIFADTESEQTYDGINFSFKRELDTIGTYINIFGSIQQNANLFDYSTIEDYSIFNYSLTDSLHRYSANTESEVKNIYFNAHYNYQISEKSRVLLTYSASLRLNDKNIDYYYIFDTLYIPQSKSDFHNSQNHEINLRYGKSWTKFKIDAGVKLSTKFYNGYFLRYNLDNKDTVININKIYIEPHPSVSLYYTLNKANELKLTFSRTTKAPYFHQLNDFTYKNNSYYWSSGNSKLKSVSYYSVYLNYSYSKPKFNYTTDLFVSISDNEISRIVYPITTMVSLSKYENAFYKQTIGFDNSIWYRLNKRINMSLSFRINMYNFERKELSVNTSNSNDISGFGYYFKYNSSIKLGKCKALIYLNYTGKELTYNGYIFARFNSSFNINRRFLGNKFTVALGVKNILDDYINYGSVSDNFGVYTETNYFGTKYNRQFFISMKYIFRKGDRNTKNINL